MPSTYTGDPAATQSPGPLPSLDTANPPKAALPVDGVDPRSAGSLYQPLKEAMDWLAYFQKYLRTDSLGTWIHSSKGVALVGAANFAFASAPPYGIGCSAANGQWGIAIELLKGQKLTGCKFHVFQGSATGNVCDLVQLTGVDAASLPGNVVTSTTGPSSTGHKIITVTLASPIVMDGTMEWVAVWHTTDAGGGDVLYGVEPF